MSEGKRPGGLTALAVLNFIFSGFNLLGVLGMAAMIALLGMVPTEQMEPAARQQFEALQDMGMGVLMLGFILSSISCALLLVSGIGYIKQKRVMGRILGSTYAIIAILSSVVTGFMFGAEAGGGFGIGTIIGLVYPILTLVLLNTTFKDDLTN